MSRGNQGIWCALRYSFGSRTPGIKSAYAAPPNPSASSSGTISHNQLLVDDPSACCVGFSCCCVVSGACSVVRGAELPGFVAGTEVAADCFADGSGTSVVRAADTLDEVAGTTVTVDSFAEVVVRAADCSFEGISVGVVRGAESSAAGSVVSVVRGADCSDAVGVVDVAGVEVAVDGLVLGSTVSVVRGADTSDEVAGTTVTVDSFAGVVVHGADTSDEAGVVVVGGVEVAVDGLVLGSTVSVVRGADILDEVAGTTVTVDSFAEVVVRAAE